MKLPKSIKLVNSSIVETVDVDKAHKCLFAFSCIHSIHQTCIILNPKVYPPLISEPIYTLRNQLLGTPKPGKKRVQILSQFGSAEFDP